MGPVYEVPSHPENLWRVRDCFARGAKDDPANVYIELIEVSTQPVPSEFELDTVSLFARDFVRTAILVQDEKVDEWYQIHHPAGEEEEPHA